MESQQSLSKNYSFEFFPPQSEDAAAKLATVRDELAEMDPLYFSVTFGAGGSTQQGTYDTVVGIKRAGYDAAPHLTCVGSTRSRIAQMLENYRAAGINRIVALRGDMPSGMRGAGELRYADELVAFIRETTGDHFHIEVAAYPETHPQARNVDDDIINFKRKVDAGADGAITQYFFNADAYYRFVDECERLGITIPIVPGIMPITNYSQLARFSDMCGAEIPRWITKRLTGYADDRNSIRAFGEEVITDLCGRLLDAGAPGLHFYTMNQAKSSIVVLRNLGLG